MLDVETSLAALPFLERKSFPSARTPARHRGAPGRRKQRRHIGIPVDDPWQKDALS